MAALLPAPLSGLSPLYPYIRPLIIPSVSAFCAEEPPGWPDVSGLLWQAILAGGEVGAGLVIAEALTQIAANAYWYLACQCITGSTPAAPTAPTPDTPIPTINTPGLPAPATAPCQTSDQFGPNLMNTTTPNTTFAFDQRIDSQFRVPPWTSGGAIGPYRNVTSGIVHAENQAAGGVHTAQTWQVQTRAFLGATVTSGQQYVLPSGTKLDIPFNLPSGDREILVPVFTTSSSATNNTLAKVDLYCGTAPGGQALPCCPPDPVLIGQLQQILNLVTLVQRQLAPFAYVPSTVHAGLSGAGTLSVQGLLGAKIEVTTLPDWYGRRGTDPEEVFDLGFITWGADDAYPMAVRLERALQLSTPRSASLYTDLAYDLSPGVVVTITELLREP